MHGDESGGRDATFAPDGVGGTHLTADIVRPLLQTSVIFVRKHWHVSLYIQSVHSFRILIRSGLVAIRFVFVWKTSFIEMGI